MIVDTVLVDRGCFIVALEHNRHEWLYNYASEAYIHQLNQKMKILDCNANTYSINTIFGTASFQITLTLKSNASKASTRKLLKRKHTL